MHSQAILHRKERKITGKLLRAAKSGDRHQTLIELRDFLAKKLEKAESDRDISAMAHRLMQVTTEIETIQKANSQKVTPLVEMRQKVKVVK